MPKYSLEIAGYDPYEQAGDCVYDPEAGDHVVDFFENVLTHVKGHMAKHPFILAPWLKTMTRNLFGWKRPDGTRRYRKCLLYVPRKNAKSVYMAGIALYMLAFDDEPGAEIYSCAGKKDQAKKVFEHAMGMVYNHQRMSERIKVNRGYLSMELMNDPASVYKCIAGDGKTEHGGNSHAVLFDELHVQKNMDLYEALKTSMGSRRQPLFMMATTADFNRDSLCNEQLHYAEAVRDNKIHDPAFLPVIYAANEKTENWKDEEVWKKANPNWGLSLNADYIRDQFKEAEANPAVAGSFKRLHLNIKTDVSEYWIPMESWNDCKKQIPIDEVAGESCFGGLDVASNEDLAAFGLYFPRQRAFYVWYWLPEENVLKYEKYKQWIEDGYIIPTEGNVIDHESIIKKIVELNKLYDLIDLGFDPWEASYISNKLEEEYGINCFKFPQNIGSLSEPSHEFFNLIKRKELVHSNNPVLTWNAQNASIKRRVDNPDQYYVIKRSSKGKIDGIVCSVMALGRAMAAGYEVGTVYDNRPALII